MEWLKETWNNIVFHYKEGGLNYPMIIYISLAHIIGVIGIACIPYCHKFTLLWAFILWPLT